MSVAMWNCHSWPQHVSSNVKLPFLTSRYQQQCKIASLENLMSAPGGLSDSLSGYFTQKFWLISDLGHFICQVPGGYIWQLIWVPHLKIWTHIWSWSLHPTNYGGISDLVEHFIWKWLAKMSFNNNISYYIWQMLALIVEISVAMSVTMWNCHSWPVDVSSNVKLPFLTSRCQ